MGKRALQGQTSSGRDLTFLPRSRRDLTRRLRAISVFPNKAFRLDFPRFGSTIAPPFLTSEWPGQGQMIDLDRAFDPKVKDRDLDLGKRPAQPSGVNLTLSFRRNFLIGPGHSKTGSVTSDLDPTLPEKAAALR